MKRGAGREVNNHCNFMLFWHWLSQRQGKSSDWIGGKERAHTNTKAFPAFEVTVSFAKLQLLVLETLQWADPKCKTDVRSRDGSTPPATEKLCHHCPQQKDRVKMVATESNLSVTCKEETRKLLSLVTKRAQNDIGMEHPGPSCHQERSSDRLNKRAHNLDPIRNWEPETITTLIKSEKSRWQQNPQHLMAGTRPKRQGSLKEPGGQGKEQPKGGAVSKLQISHHKDVMETWRPFTCTHLTGELETDTRLKQDPRARLAEARPTNVNLEADTNDGTTLRTPREEAPEADQTPNRTRSAR